MFRKILYFLLFSIVYPSLEQSTKTKHCWVQYKHSFLDDKNNPWGPAPQFLDTKIHLPARRKIVSKGNTLQQSRTEICVQRCFEKSVPICSNSFAKRVNKCGYYFTNVNFQQMNIFLNSLFKSKSFICRLTEDSFHSTSSTKFSQHSAQIQLNLRGYLK